jgi:hypothetical protein
VPNPDGVTRFGAIWGVFPDDLTPVESLGVFDHAGTSGEWRLEVGCAPGAVPVFEPGRVVSWALEILPKTVPSKDADHVLSIPVAANVPGVSATYWTSELRLANPSPTDGARIRMFLMPTNENDLSEIRQADLQVPAGMTVDLPDVVASRFGLTRRTGNLLLQIEGPPLLATSRISTANDGGGSYGQHVVGTGSDDGDAFFGGPPMLLPHLADTAAFRTNIGFSERVGSPATVELVVFDGTTGLEIGTPTRHEVAGFSHVQFRLRTKHDHANVYAMIRVVEGGGRIRGYASLVDNGTHDSIYIPATPARLADNLVVPVVAKNRGVGDTDWRSELRIVNSGEHPAVVRLEFRPRESDGGGLYSSIIEIPPGQSFAADDVVGSVLDMEDAAGSLRLATENEAALLVTSRTYNVIDRGTYGQFIGAVAEGTTGTAHVIHVDGGPGRRTNLGLCEVAGLPVVIRCTLLDRIGRQLGEQVLVTLDAFEMVQINNVFNALGADKTGVARLVLSRVGGDGAFAAYASVIDRVTGDAITVPARTLGE